MGHHRNHTSGHRHHSEALALLSISEMATTCSAPNLVSAVEARSFGSDDAAGRATGCSTGCSGQGVCRSGTCFCKPGFFGVTCMMATMHNTEETVEAGRAALFIAGGFGLGFIVAAIVTRAVLGRKSGEDLMHFVV